MNVIKKKAYYHLPGLFEFYELYRIFLSLYQEHREYFMTGVRSVPFTVHRQTVSGAVGESEVETKIRKKF